MYQIIFIYAFIYRNYLTVVLIQHNIKSDIRPRFKDLDVSILVEAGRVELPAKNQSRTASPSADICLHSLKPMPNVRPRFSVAPNS